MALRIFTRRVWGATRTSPWKKEAGCYSCVATESSAALEYTADKGARSQASNEAEDPLRHPDFFGVNAHTSVGQLFEARVHLGHKTGAWDPRMKPYLFGSRAGLHIIDLDKTLVHLRRALNVAGHVAYRNGIILFVNERSQFERIVQKAARDCGEYFVTQRWIGGTLTNSQMLLRTLQLPDLFIFLSVPPSKTAITEAAMSNIPSIGIVDSDCNPNLITYPVPGNDDSPTSLELYCSLFSEVITRAKRQRTETPHTGGLTGRLTGQLETASASEDVKISSSGKLVS